MLLPPTPLASLGRDNLRKITTNCQLPAAVVDGQNEDNFKKKLDLHLSHMWHREFV